MSNNPMKGRRNPPFNKGIAQKNKEEKVARAEARKAISSQRTPAQRLAILNQRLGVGIGARHERELLKNFLIPVEEHTKEN